MATSFLRFGKAGNVNGVAFPVGGSGVGCAAGRIHTESRVNYAHGGLPLLLFHCLPYSTREGFLHSSLMDKQQHKYLRIQMTPAVDTAPPPWCQSNTLPLNSLPLDDHAIGQALKLNTASCQIYAPFHFEVHQFSCPHCFP